MEEEGPAIRFTYDSVLEFPGSPVFNSGYKVKGIYIWGKMNEDGTNSGSAMKLSNVRPCITKNSYSD